ncbi:sensor histidine kinase [Sediminivirga luteola]|uniref:histidine kinase n=1 Tax=Sediminivirga luteola TaxID=1774748 RepID=A0A8J2TX32_9MICO|nr:histidine kinase [Sediminivirga luteola]MCI2265487.1 histidine kinase [Sediminivirga luteola]GGA10238.1 hypothetical protein GCM10011333_11200 [Sediminivirga luteola]
MTLVNRRAPVPRFFSTTSFSTRGRVLFGSVAGFAFVVELTATLLRIDGSSFLGVIETAVIAATLIVTAWQPSMGGMLVMLAAFSAFWWTDADVFNLAIAPAAALVARASRLPLAVLFGATVVAWATVLSNTQQHMWFDGVGAATLAAIGAAVGVAFRIAAARTEKLHDQIAEHQQERQRAVTFERKQIARELHDVVAHGLTVIAMQARVLDTAQAPAARERAQLAIGDASRQALADLRRMLVTLRDDMPEASMEPDEASGTLAQRIDDFAHRLETAGAHVDTAVTDGIDLPRSKELTAIRVAQEATTNILKHAPGCQHVTFEVAHADEGVEIVITNSAPPPNTELPPASGFGLVGLRERLDLFSGTLEAGPHEDGWRVRAWLPGDER